MAIKKISEFTAGTPTSADKILFEQDEAGKSTTIGDAVNTCSLTFEEIQATTNLTGKVAGADSIKPLLKQRIYNIAIYFAESEQNTSAVFQNVKMGYRISGIIVGNGNGTPFFRYCQLFKDGRATEVSIDSGTISGTDNGDGTANITIGSVNQWGRYNLIVFYT